jgi:16S rRNA (adenine1518-N6/adenine1519-N6)-dimethyltransferase
MKDNPPAGNGLTHQARKRFGQNFLHDTNVIERIIATIGASAEDQLLEIGPGQAALTDLLAESGARLDCVELDRDLAKFLKQRFLGNERVTIHQQDVLKFDPRTLRPESHSLRVVGNLPYNISTPVIFHLLKYHGLIRDMVFMLQLEVIQRMVAGPDDKNYGRLGLMLQYYCQVEHLFNVPSAAFTPRPKVVSAIVRLTPHREMPLTAKDPACLETVIRTAFNQRRKTLKNSLKPLFSTEAMAQLPIDTSLRPENLSLADYVVISDKLSELQSQNPDG